MFLDEVICQSKAVESNADFEDRAEQEELKIS